MCRTNAFCDSSCNHIHDLLERGILGFLSTSKEPVNVHNIVDEMVTHPQMSKMYWAWDKLDPNERKNYRFSNRKNTPYWRGFAQLVSSRLSSLKKEGLVSLSIKHAYLSYGFWELTEIGRHKMRAFLFSKVEESLKISVVGNRAA